MKLIKNLIGGLAGAVALNLLHETVRHFDSDAPRVDLVGEEGVNKLVEGAGGKPLKGKSLYAAALAGDLISNSLYFSTIGGAKKKDLLFRGATCGLAAGIGTLSLTRRMGLDDSPVNRTRRKRVLTVSYYLVGGLVAGLTIRCLRSLK